jgi:hypothetical protein
MDRVQPTDTSSEPTVQNGAITHFGTETYPQGDLYYRTFLVAIQDNLDRITGQLCPTNKT